MSRKPLSTLDKLATPEVATGASDGNDNDNSIATPTTATPSDNTKQQQQKKQQQQCQPMAIPSNGNTK